LGKYLNAFIDKESRILEFYGQGSPEDQYSYTVEPLKVPLVQKLLSPLDKTSLVDLTSRIKKEFCSPMTFLPRMPTGPRTVLNGPTFQLTLSTGGCELDLDFGDNNLPFPTIPKGSVKCTGHEVSYTRTPVSIHTQEVLPEAFTTSECKVERTFGNEYQKVDSTVSNMSGDIRRCFTAEARWCTLTPSRI